MRLSKHSFEAKCASCLKEGTDGRFPPFWKSLIVMTKTGLFKQYEKTLRLSPGSLEEPE